MTKLRERRSSVSARCRSNSITALRRNRQAAIHTIDGKEFSGEVGVSVLLNKVEEWKVTNNSTFISHPFHIHINPFQVTEVFAPNSTLADGTTPMYVVSTDNNAPLKPGQCLVNPDNPATWRPCVATVPASHRDLVGRLSHPFRRLREEERRHARSLSMVISSSAAALSTIRAGSSFTATFWRMKTAG